MSDDIAAVSVRWIERQVRLPRLAASLVTCSVPVQRPLPTDHRIAAGDRVRVVVWCGQMINEIVPVQPNGDLAVPTFGFVPVAGLTEYEAQTRVLELVRSRFMLGSTVVAVDQPKVQVVIRRRRSGAARLPGAAAGRHRAGSAGLCRRCPGTRQPAAHPRQRSGAKAQEIDLYRIALEGDTTLLAPLPRSAVVFVPLAGPQVQVFGAVQRNASIELTAGASLAEAIRLAGGLRVEGEPDTLRVLREEADGQRLYTVTISELKRFIAQDGDRILVSVQRDLNVTARVLTVRGAVHRPGAYSYHDRLTVQHALELAGGLMP